MFPYAVNGSEVPFYVKFNLKAIIQDLSIGSVNIKNGDCTHQDESIYYGT